jgi:hypothetical protein
MIFSPGFLVMMSTVGFLLGTADLNFAWNGGRRRLGRLNGLGRSRSQSARRRGN